MEEFEDEIQIEQGGPDFVMEELVTYLSRSTFTDLRIWCQDGVTLSAHCAVLAASSRYLKQLFESAPLVPQGITCICLPSYPSRIVKQYLELIYNGEIAVEEDKIILIDLLKHLEVTREIKVQAMEEPLPLSPYVEIEATEEDEDDEVLDVVKTEPDLEEEEEDGEARVEIFPIPLLQQRESPQHQPRSREKNTKKRISELMPPSVSITKRIKSELEESSTTASASSSSSAPVSQFLGPKPMRLPLSQPLDMSSLAKEYLDERTREMLGYQTQYQHQNSDLGGPASANRCRCILCMNPDRILVKGSSPLHMCHYPDCGKQYKKTSHLRAHLRGHVGDQPYLCSWPGCQKRFTRSDELHRHFRIHTGEKNHKCEHCEKMFSRWV
jgi:hypothetical protein